MKRLILHCELLGPNTEGKLLAVELPGKKDLDRLRSLTSRLAESDGVESITILKGDPLAVFDSLPQLDEAGDDSATITEKGVVVDLNEAQDGEPGYRGLRMIVSAQGICYTFYHKYDQGGGEYESLTIPWADTYELSADLAKESAT